MNVLLGMEGFWYKADTPHNGKERSYSSPSPQEEGEVIAYMGKKWRLNRRPTIPRWVF